MELGGVAVLARGHEGRPEVVVGRLLLRAEHVEDAIAGALEEVASLDYHSGLVDRGQLHEEVARGKDEGVGDRGLDAEVGLEEPLEARVEVFAALALEDGRSLYSEAAAPQYLRNYVAGGKRALLLGRGGDGRRGCDLSEGGGLARRRWRQGREGVEDGGCADADAGDGSG